MKALVCNCKAGIVLIFERRQVLAQRIALITLVVRDYDEAIRYFTEILRFTLTEDATLSEGKRWVTVSPTSAEGSALLLAKASSFKQEERIGDQTGGRVALFLQTDDFFGDYHDMLARGVRFAETPREEPYGTVAVFLDLYGNRWDLLQLRAGNS